MLTFRYRGFVSAGCVAVLAGSVWLIGCGSGLGPNIYSDATAITGNWQLSSNSAAASRLPSLSGQLTGSNPEVTGTFHSNSEMACVSPTTSIKLSGFAGLKGAVTLTGQLAGGTLTISGTLAADGSTLSSAKYNVIGGDCAFSGPADATVQSYSPLTGTYIGNFVDSNGYPLPVNLELSQTMTPDANGNFLLSGSSTQLNNPCFSGLIYISNAMVTGDSFTLTYTDTNRGDTVVVYGTLSRDASALTITRWVLGGRCGSANGIGLLLRQ